MRLPAIPATPRTAPAFLAKDQEQRRDRGDRVRAPSPRRVGRPIRSCGCTRAPARFRSRRRPTRGAAPKSGRRAGRGRHAKFYFINRAAARSCARGLFAPNDATPAYPVLRVLARAPVVQRGEPVVPRGDGRGGLRGDDRRSAGPGRQRELRPLSPTAPRRSTARRATRALYENDMSSALDFVLSKPANPLSARASSRTEPARRPTTRTGESVDPEHIGIAGPLVRRDRGDARSASRTRASTRSSRTTISTPTLAAERAATHPPTLFFATDYAFPRRRRRRCSNPRPRSARRGHRLRPARRRGRRHDVDHARASDHCEWGYQPFPANFPSSRYGERVVALLHARVVRPLSEAATRARRAAWSRDVLRRDRRPALDRRGHLRRCARRPPAQTIRSRATSRTQIGASAPRTCSRSTTARPITSRAARSTTPATCASEITPQCLPEPALAGPGREARLLVRSARAATHALDAPIARLMAWRSLRAEGGRHRDVSRDPVGHRRRRTAPRSRASSRTPSSSSSAAGCTARRRTAATSASSPASRRSA